MRYIVFLIVLTFLFCSRLTSIQTSREEAAQQEVFDPERLPDTFIIPGSSLGSYRRVEAGEIKMELPSGIVGVDSTLSVPGYRIQIFTSTSFLRAEEAYINAIAAIMDEPITKIFDPPFYKIRVGDYLRREDAEMFKIQKLKKLYPDAWVVPTRIFPYRMAPRVLLDDSLLYSDTTKVKKDTSP